MDINSLRVDYKKYPHHQDAIKKAAEVLKNGGYLCYCQEVIDEVSKEKRQCYNFDGITKLGQYCERCKVDYPIYGNNIDPDTGRRKYKNVEECQERIRQIIAEKRKQRLEGDKWANQVVEALT